MDRNTFLIITIIFKTFLGIKKLCRRGELRSPAWLISVRALDIGAGAQSDAPTVMCKKWRPYLKKTTPFVKVGANCVRPRCLISVRALDIGTGAQSDAPTVMCKKWRPYGNDAQSNTLPKKANTSLGK
ncbi:MAG TPA: hypothetical protein VFC74_08580 [Oscillospiraceae bacterium]|nr:hypothetical protein [Oscillospiraceae bacterium]